MEDLDLQGLYLKEQLQKGIRRIFEEQRSIAVRKLAGSQGRSGELMRSLTNPDYKVSSLGSTVHAVIRYPLEIRFQDMKHLGHWKIYNKQVWGILYKETFRDIRYEFSDWLRERVRLQLQEALNP